MKKVRKVVIPAAGFGTRFLPATKAQPKEMLPIVDKPIIQYVVEELVEAGIEDIIIVTGYHKRNIEDHFDKPSSELIENLKMGGEKKQPLIESIERISDMANFIYVRQKGPYGNGTPLLNVRHIIGDEPFIYTWSDDFFKASPKSRFQQLIEIYDEFGWNVMASIKATHPEHYARYGFAAGKQLREGLIDAETIIEKPGKKDHLDGNALANVSGFIFNPEIFDYLEKASQNLRPGEELWYNDALKLMLADKIHVLACEIKNGKYYDTGNKLDYLRTVVEFALQNPEVQQQFREFLKELHV